MFLVEALIASAVVYACITFGLFVFFPGVFLSSRVTRACPVTADLIMRVNVRTTTTTLRFILIDRQISISPSHEYSSSSSLHLQRTGRWYYCCSGPVYCIICMSHTAGLQAFVVLYLWFCLYFWLVASLTRRAAIFALGRMRFPNDVLASSGVWLPWYYIRMYLAKNIDAPLTGIYMSLLTLVQDTL